MATRIARGRDFLDWLAAAGIVPKDAPVRRVVIEAAVDTPILIYVELYGTDKMIRVTPSDVLRAAKVEILGG